MTTFSKVTTVDTTNLQPGELIHMEFAFFNVNFIHGFTSMLTGVFAKIIMIWLLPNTPIINSLFKKHPMSWKIIHCHLSHPSNGVLK